MISALHSQRRDLEEAIERLIQFVAIRPSYPDDGWMGSAWMEECQERLAEHVEKGDPRDVAAYCAFMWHHGWRTKRADPRDNIGSTGRPERWVP